MSIGVQFYSMPIHNRSRNLSARSCLSASARASSERRGEGKYKGRKPTARAKADDIVRLAGEGVKREDIAARLGVGVASVKASTPQVAGGVRS